MKRKRTNGPTSNGEKRGKETIPALSEEEAALYDRQLRLWGVAAQQRMRKSSVLVLGLSGIAGEVCKNIVLAGVGNVTVIDSNPVDEGDLSALFFVDEEDVGKNRAIASSERIQSLNPKVSVECMATDFESLTEEFISSFDVVCSSECSLEEEKWLDSICAKNSIGFFATRSFGFYSYYFCNLNGHCYTEEIDVVKKATKDINSEEKEKEIERETQTIEGRIVCSSLVDALNVPWVSLTKQKIPKLYYGARLLEILDSERLTNETVSISDVKSKALMERGLNDDFISDSLLEELLRSRGHDISPFCAIIGGILGQEIIRVISAKDKPIINFLFFDGYRNSAVIENIAPSKTKQTNLVSKEHVVIDLL